MVKAEIKNIMVKREMKILLLSRLIIHIFTCSEKMNINKPMPNEKNNNPLLLLFKLVLPPRYKKWFMNIVSLERFIIIFIKTPAQISKIIFINIRISPKGTIIDIIKTTGMFMIMLSGFKILNVNAEYEVISI